MSFRVEENVAKNKKPFDRRWLAGVVTVLCPVFDNYWWLLAYAVIFGFLSGSFGALLPSVIIQVD